MKPRHKGNHPDYSMFVVEVSVCEDQSRELWSDHKPQDHIDQMTMRNMQTYGQEQLSHALLTEALRREMFFQCLVRMSADENFLTKLQAMEDEDRSDLESELGDHLYEHVTRVSEKIAPEIVKEVLEMLLEQASAQRGG